MHRRTSKHLRVVLLISAAILGLTWVALRGIVSTRLMLERLEFDACDNLLFELRGPLPAPSDIVIVAVDPFTVRAMGRAWPFPRAWHAEVIRRLKAWGARVIAFDIAFDTPASPEGDAALVRACRSAGNVVVGAELAVSTVTHEGIRYPAQTILLPFPALEAAARVGLVNFQPESDAVTRRAFARYPAVGGRQPALLSVLAAALYAGERPDQLFQGGVLRVGHRRIPLDAEEGFWINYCGPPQHIRNVSYYQVLPDYVPGSSDAAGADRGRLNRWGRALFGGKLVFIGVTDPMQHDVTRTPYGSEFPGVEVHANIANTVLRNMPLRRLPEWSGPVLAWILALAVGAISVLGRPTRALAYLAVLSAGYCAGAVHLFSAYQVWPPVVVPLGGASSAFIGGALYRWLVEHRERRRISALFSKYVSKEVARELMEDEAASQLGSSHRQRLTCLFSDIRGFTTLSEQLPPEEVVRMLNEYFDRMVDVVFAHRGTLDKYVGDAIMATFGVPKSYGNDAERACRTALGMQEELQRLQRRWLAEGRPAIDIGIGIHSGEAVVGTIGHRDRLEFACIGDTINTASRLEGLNKDLGTRILISESTYREVRDLDLFEVRRLPPATVKGKAEPVQVYELVGWKNGAVPAQSEARAPATAA